jgi:hypothetical protein
MEASVSAAPSQLLRCGSVPRLRKPLGTMTVHPRSFLKVDRPAW